jgi:uncharacterized protein involved in exopolysaccharide biosynthesis
MLKDNSSPQSVIDPSVVFSEMNLIDLFKTMFKFKLLVASFTSVFSIIAILYALQLPDIYRSDAILSLSEKFESQNSGALSAMGNIANMAGIDIGNPESTKADEGVAIMKSLNFFEALLEKQDMYIPLLAAKDWDKEVNKLIIDESKYDQKSQKWLDFLIAGDEYPSSQKAFSVFKKGFTVSKDKSTGFILVSIEHYSPFIAQQWVEALVNEINIQTRDSDVAVAERSIIFLNEQLSKTNIAEIKYVLSSLIQKQTQTIMLAKSSPEYLFKTLDRPIASELKIKPARTIICVFGLFIGLIFGFIAALLKQSFLTRST